MSQNRLPEPRPDWALFLDFDGTLVEIADHPDLARPDPAVPGVLGGLREALGGAVAIVSGRGLSDLDRALGVPGLAVAGIHGLERRDAQGRVYRPVDPAQRFRDTRLALERFVREHPGTAFEDKGGALALHYRRAPAAEAAAAALLEAECRRLGDEFQVQRGKAVFELRLTGHHKGTVVASFMEEPPFAGRVPVFIGDDVTDEDAFRFVNHCGGHTIRVGPLDGSAARWTVASVDEVLRWLTIVPARIRQGGTRHES